MRIVLEASCLTALLLAPLAFGEIKPNPIDEQDLLNGIKANLPVEELVVYIRNRGVGFLLTPKNRQKFALAKASPKIIEAIEASVREQISTPPPPACPELPKEPPFQVPDGAPLSRREILILLQSRVAVDRVTKLVEGRGVDFHNLGDSSKELRAAGGTHELNGIILENYRGPKPEEVAVTAPAPVADRGVSPPAPARVVIPTQVAIPWSELQTKATRKTQPLYTAEMKNRGLTGLVTMRMVVAGNGKVKTLTPVAGPEMLIKVAIEAYKRWEFKPTLVSGVPVEVSTEFTLRF
ncbi:MAG: energy transducer TonB [Acidobacteria bacterium]|nr:energy transducer TonB [Acidobacteriota bacterium]